MMIKKDLVYILDEIKKILDGDYFMTQNNDDKINAIKFLLQKYYKED